MALKRVDENPSSEDVILFDILTPNSNGCLADPYKIDKVTIYFVERNFSMGSTRLYQKGAINPSAQLAAQTAEQAACLAPSETNLATATRLRAIANATYSTSDVYFSNANPVETYGNPDYPGWLSTDVTESSLYHEVQEFGVGLDGMPILLDPATGLQVPIPGHFLLQWDPQGAAREGDYFICWTWTPNPAGASLIAHIPFSVSGSTELTQSIPTHFTVPEKYDILLERYLPEMFKLVLTATDLTPEVLDKLNRSVAMGFTTVENLANQIIDLLDANSCHEVLIPYLANLFNLKLRSGDPTLWRRQIKRAIPLFKRKGTLEGLREALDLAGVTLVRYTRLHQVTSQYSRTEFFVQGPEPFRTAFQPTDLVPGSNPNFALWTRAAGSPTWESRAASLLAWVPDGDGNLVLQIAYPLAINDQALVRYGTRVVPGSSEQTVESYLQSLLLADQREEQTDGSLIYPLKNWNVRTIDEDDPLLPLICPNVNSYADALIFGHVRTEFPYSENIWNMDEYNGSTRESNQPCDIDRDFLDSCSCCLSSKFNLDLEIENLSNDKVQECQDIVREYVPFHAILHMINLSGRFSEFIHSPVETVETLIQYRLEENVLAGNANNYFNRSRGNGYGGSTRDFRPGEDDNPFDPDDFLENGTIDSTYLTDVGRSMLANSETVMPTTTGIAYNESIRLFCAEAMFDRLGMAPPLETELEVLAPSPHQGKYQVDMPDRNTTRVLGVIEPLDPAQFTFRLSNLLYRNGGGTVAQDDLIRFTDPSEQLAFSQANPGETITLGSIGTFTISQVFPNGLLMLDDPDRLIPPTNATGIPYTMGDLSGTGTTSITRRGRIESYDLLQPIMRYHARIGDYILLDQEQYRVAGFDSVRENVVYLEGYASGDAAGIDFTVYRRLLDNEVGSLAFHGLLLDCLTNQENALQIQDGSSQPTDVDLRLESTVPGRPAFMGNFLVLIDQDYYLITDIYQNIMTLSGPAQSWGTASSGGSAVLYSVIQFINVTTNLTGVGETLNIDGQEYEFLDRRGNDTVHRVIARKPTLLSALAATALNAGPGNYHEPVSHDEQVTFTIEYADGPAQHGEI